MADTEFYDSQTPPGSIRPVDLIQDKGVARDLADIEAPAQEARIRREQELKREHDTGLNDGERENLKLMDGLKEKYPDAFTDLVDAKGRKLMLVKHNAAQERLSKPDAIFTQEGHLYLQMPANTLARWNLTEFDFTPLVDLAQNAQGKIDMEMSLVKKDKVELSAVGAYVRSMDLTNDNMAKGVRELLTEVQKAEKDWQVSSQNQSRAATAETILAKL